MFVVKQNTDRGFTLVGAMVGMGILGILTFGFMEFMRGSLEGQQKLMQVRDLSDLKNEMGMLLDSENHCRNSLAGPGAYGSPDKPVTFKKTEIDEDKEGREVELYVSSQDGKSHRKKMFSAGDSYGTLTIKSIKMLMDTDTNPPGNDYSHSEDQFHEDIGTLRVTAQMLGREQSFDVKMSMLMKTDNSGQTTLYSCSGESSARRCGKDQKWHFKCGCMTPASYTEALNNPDSPCAIISDFVEFNRYTDGSQFGKWKLCSLSHVYIYARCRRHYHECRIIRKADGTWVGVKGEYFDGCRSVHCSAVCFGGEGEGCPAPSKFINNKCISCEPPNQWYENACANCPSGEYSHRCQKCKRDCVTPADSPDGSYAYWNDSTCGCQVMIKDTDNTK